MADRGKMTEGANGRVIGEPIAGMAPGIPDGPRTFIRFHRTCFPGGPWDRSSASAEPWTLSREC